MSTLNVEVTIQCLSNIWRSLGLLLINCEVEFDLSWAKYCVLIQCHNDIGNKFYNYKLYVTVVTLSLSNNTTFMKDMKKRF